MPKAVGFLRGLAISLLLSASAPLLHIFVAGNAQQCRPIRKIPKLLPSLRLNNNPCRRAAVAMLLLLLALACTRLEAQTVSAPKTQNPELKAVLTQAVLMRALAIEQPASLGSQLNSFPLGFINMAHRNSPEWTTVWSTFFKGALTQVTLHAKSPRILYLNPVADVAVVARCDGASRGAGNVRCGRLCAMPAELLGGINPSSRAPLWWNAANPLKALRDTAHQRVANFVAQYDSPRPAPARQVCSQVAQGGAEVRLLDLFLASDTFKNAAFSSAISSYLSARLSHPPPRGQDPAFEVLSGIKDLSLTAAIPLNKEGWIVFLTPKASGWSQAALILKSNSSSQLSVESADVMSF
jgi:hypothetical protein